MARTTSIPDETQDHLDAVALLEELAGFLRLPMDRVRELAERITGKPWQELDMQGAEEVAQVLAEALHRILTRQAARVR